MPDRYIPKLDNYYLDIERVRDDFEASLAIYEFPFTNKNKINHLGMRPRRMSVDCSFQDNPPLTPGWSTSGNIVMPTYNEHFFFLEYIRSKRDNYTFTHPKYGEIVGKINSVSSYHDDTDEYVRITFEFIEETTTEEISQIKYIVADMTKAWTDGNAKVTDKIEESQADATSAVQWTAGAQLFIADMNTYLNTLTTPANSIVNTINYGTSTPGLMMQSLNRSIDRVVQLYQTGRNAPASFINNLIVGVRDLKATLSGANARNVHIMGASRVAYEAGVIYDEDDQNFRQIKTKEGAISFDIMGNYIGAVVLPDIMTLTELEFSLYEVRKLINEAILLDRDNRPLQEQSRKLQDYISRIKLDRDRIETKSYPLQSMHQVTMDNGLTYNAAERILKLNPDILNPNFTNGDVKVLVPAS
jgi:hypothetical protein